MNPIQKHVDSLEWLCPHRHHRGNCQDCADELEGALSGHSQAPPRLQNPAGLGLRFSSLQVSLLLLISQHPVQSRQLGPLQCLEVMPPSSDSDAETEHQPGAKGF